MYKLEDIKPKRYPKEKPSKEGWYLAYLNVHGTWTDYHYEVSRDTIYPWDTRPITWFIDIPGAPPELKPLAYPQNKPSEDGEYWCHNKERDAWYSLRWDRSHSWNSNIDYFIPYRLDKENEMELKILVDWRKDKDMVNLNTGRVTKDDFRTICTQFLDAEGYDVAKRVGQPSFKDKVLWHDKHIEITDLDGFTDIFMIASISSPKRYVFVTDEQLAECHKAVEEREPELKDCPNPECRWRHNVYVKENIINSDDDYVLHYVLCEGCGYCGPEAKTPQEAIRLHNLIAKNAKRSSLFELENEYYGLWCDEDGNVLPRKES
jgi:Pyruvate/2-oxoacid:ferredoxin oxidoreductase delta subunit